MPLTPQLLLVDDDPQKRALLAHFLLLEFPHADIVQVDSGAAAIAHLERQSVDAVVSNHSMQPVNGVELARWIRSHRRDLPLVMVTGNTHVAEAALAAGVDAVLDTAHYVELGPAVRRLLRQPPPDRLPWFRRAARPTSAARCLVRQAMRAAILPR